MIYLDNSATTKPYSEVLHTYREVAEKIWGNPSSLHNMGSQASRILEASRKQIAELLGKLPDEIFFTSGGTEGNNWVLKGVAFEKRAYGNHIIISAIEHPSVRETAKWLETQGFEVQEAPVTKEGFLDLEAFQNLIRPETILVSLMAVNNEIGSIQPIQAVSKLLENQPKISFHVDGVQALGKIDQDLYLTDRVDFATFSSHKFHGVRGVGLLYKKAGKKLSPLLHGGGQESGLRSTTENLAGIAATAKALRLNLGKAETTRNRMQQIKSNLLDALASYSDISIFSGLEDFAPHILTFGLKNVRGEVTVHAFEKHDIYLSTTSACSSKAGHAAGTLMAMGVKSQLATTAVRLSLSEDTDMSQIEHFLTILKLIYSQTEKVRK